VVLVAVAADQAHRWKYTWQPHWKHTTQAPSQGNNGGMEILLTLVGGGGGGATAVQAQMATNGGLPAVMSAAMVGMVLNHICNHRL
jgi:hypothetical protein